MKRILAVLMIMTMAFALVGCGKQSTGVAEKVRVGYAAGVPTANLILAKVEGYFEDELKDMGIDVEWFPFLNGPPLNEAIAAGEIDIGFLGDVAFMMAKASGQNTVIFSKGSEGEPVFALTIAKDSPITSVEQLKGKKVAFTRGTIMHRLLYNLLTKSGLSLSDVEHVNIPGSDIANAINLKQVEAGVLWEPFIASNIQNGILKVLADGTGAQSNSCYNIVVEKFANENPKILEAFIRAMERANKDIVADPKKAAEKTKDELGLPAQTVEELLLKMKFTSVISDSDMEELREIEKFLRDEKLTENTVNVNKAIDRSYLKTLGME